MTVTTMLTMMMLMMMMTTVAVVMAVVTAAAVTVDNVAVRLGLPEGPGLSGVCLYRTGADKRQNVMFKSVASARKKNSGDGGGRDYMVAGELAADRVYEGTFARLADGDQVARFGCEDGQRFEIATPFVVPERDLDTILAVKESMERRFGPQPSRQQPHRSVTEEHVSVTLRGLRPAGAGDDGRGHVTVDVFQLYKRRKPQAAANGDSGGGGVLWDAKAATVPRYSAQPYARYALPHPVGSLVLADLPPDQMLAVKLRRPAADDHGTANRTENAVFIYTGGLYPRHAANLTDMLMDERSGGHGSIIADPSPPDITDAAATSFQIDAKLAHRDSYGERSILLCGVRMGAI